MKHFLLFSILFSSVQIFCFGRIAQEYNILSDTKSDTISKGYCIITGKVTTWNDSGEKSEIINGVISTIDHKYRSVTDNQGNYILRIPFGKIQLYFFKPQYQEIVTSNYEFKDQHIIEIDFYGRYKRQNIAVKKPVIYLYPEEEQEISVKLSPIGKFTFTYPMSNNGWKVIAQPNGLIKDKNGKEYPYLFWEAEQESLCYIREGNEMKGFIIRKDEVIAFLEKQLVQIGLNDKESTDFITYWGPILQKNKYALVQFLIDEDYDSKIGTITTEPEMQTVRRVYILCTGLDSLNEVPVLVTQNFVPFKRVGGTLIEWGGSEIPINRQIK